MTTLLTRRQTLQSLAYSAVFASPLLTLVGCGGVGHRGGGSSTDAATIVVQLPSGFSIPATDLVAGTAYDTSGVNNGTFKAKVSSNGPTFAYLQQKSTGAYVLFGLVGHGRPGVTPLASAALMVAFAFGISGLPPAGLNQALTLLETNADVQRLAATISTTLATDPLCITNGNATVTAAIKTAIDAVSHGVAPAAARPTSRADPAPLILVQPTGDQGGALVNQGDDAATIVPANTKRRPLSVYTYRVGHVAADGTATPVSPAQRVDQQEVGPTTSIIGSVSSLFTKVAFGPVSGKAVDLSVSAGDTKTLYETVVLMATGDNSAADPAFFADPKYAGEVAEWRSKLGDLNVYACLGGILFDLFQSVLGGAAIAVSFAQTAQIAARLEAAEAAGTQLVLQLARTGKLDEAIFNFVVRTASNDVTAVAYREAGLEFLGLSEAVAAHQAAGVEGAAVGGVAASILPVLAAVGTLAGLADASASYFDVLFSPKGKLWTETALKPTVVVSPSSGVVPQGASLPLTVGTPGVSETNYKFHWTLSSGGNGNIGDPTGTGGAGRDITTTGTTINLLTSPSDPADTEYTVTVEALDRNTGASLGKAKATLTVKAASLETGSYGAKTTSGSFGFVDGIAFTPVAGAKNYSLQVKEPGTSAFEAYAGSTYYQIAANFFPGQSFSGIALGYFFILGEGFAGSQAELDARLAGENATYGAASGRSWQVVAGFSFD